MGCRKLNWIERRVKSCFEVAGQRCTMATASKAERAPGEPRTCQITEGSLHSPTAATQVPMNPWTLRFNDESVEAAHRKMQAKSPTLLFVLSIFNAVSLGTYCTGVYLDCKLIQSNFLPMLLVNMTYQAIETYLYLLPPPTGQAALCDSTEPLKVLWACLQLVIVGLKVLLNFALEEMGGLCGNIASPDFCSQIGLAANGNVVICFVLIPYVTYSSLTLKMFISSGIVMAHALAPFWPTVEIEVPAICCSVFVGNAVGYVLEHSLRSVFREQYARQADQELLVQMKIAANLRLAHTIKGKCGTSNGLAAAVISCLKGIHIEQVERAVQLVHRMRFLLEEAEWWCNHRQLCVHLELGTYQSKRTVCDVKTRAEKLVGSDGVVNECAFSSCSVDETVLGLALDESLSNARQFRCPGTKIAIAMHIEATEDVSVLHLQMDSTNRANVPLLSTEQCLRVVQCGYKKHNLSAFSDGVGLANVQQAAHAVGGRIWLHGYSTLESEGGSAESRVNHTVFHLQIPVEGVAWRNFDDVSDMEDENCKALEKVSIVWSDELEEVRPGRQGPCTDQVHGPSTMAASEIDASEAPAPLSAEVNVLNVDDPL
eukprot:5093196-Pleurochrysis_carterae.AAC.1